MRLKWSDGTLLVFVLDGAERAPKGPFNSITGRHDVKFSCCQLFGVSKRVQTHVLQDMMTLALLQLRLSIRFAR